MSRHVRIHTIGYEPPNKSRTAMIEISMIEISMIEISIVAVRDLFGGSFSFVQLRNED